MPGQTVFFLDLSDTNIDISKCKVTLAISIALANQTSSHLQIRINLRSKYIMFYRQKLLSTLMTE